MGKKKKPFASKRYRREKRYKKLAIKKVIARMVRGIRTPEEELEEATKQVEKSQRWSKTPLAIRNKGKKVTGVPKYEEVQQVEKNLEKKFYERRS